MLVNYKRLKFVLWKFTRFKESLAFFLYCIGQIVSNHKRGSLYIPARLEFCLACFSR